MLKQNQSFGRKIGTAGTILLSKLVIFDEMFDFFGCTLSSL